MPCDCWAGKHSNVVGFQLQCQVGGRCADVLGQPDLFCEIETDDVALVLGGRGPMLLRL